MAEVDGYLVFRSACKRLEDLPRVGEFTHGRDDGQDIVEQEECRADLLPPMAWLRRFDCLLEALPQLLKHPVDHPRMDVVLTHKDFHGAKTRRRPESKTLGHKDLQRVVEGIVQRFPLIVHFLADTQQKFQRTDSPLVLVRGKDPQAEEIVEKHLQSCRSGLEGSEESGIRAAVEPERRLQVAHSPCALLDIRFQQFNGTPVPFMPVADIGKDPFDEPHGGGHRHELAHGIIQPHGKFLVPLDTTALDHRSPRVERCSIECQRFVDRSDAVADVEPGIPENMKDRLRRLRCCRAIASGSAENHDVDIGIGAELCTTVAAESQNRNMIHRPRGESLESGADCSVHKGGESRAGFEPSGTRFVCGGDLSLLGLNEGRQRPGVC